MNLALVVTLLAALASQPKTTICHPVGSATGGNTHAGYSIITTANPSSHIDEETGAPKHEHDGRVDFVVTADRPCPPQSPSPSPSPDPEPSPSPDPEPSPSPDPEPSESPTPGKDKDEPTDTPAPESPDLPDTGFTAGIAGMIAAALLGVGSTIMYLTRKQGR